MFYLIVPFIFAVVFLPEVTYPKNTDKTYVALEYYLCFFVGIFWFQVWFPELGMGLANSVLVSRSSLKHRRGSRCPEKGLSLGIL